MRTLIFLATAIILGGISVAAATNGIASIVNVEVPKALPEATLPVELALPEIANIDTPDVAISDVVSRIMTTEGVNALTAATEAATWKATFPGCYLTPHVTSPTTHVGDALPWGAHTTHSCVPYPPANDPSILVERSSCSGAGCFGPEGLWAPKN